MHLHKNLRGLVITISVESQKGGKHDHRASKRSFYIVITAEYTEPETLSFFFFFYIKSYLTGNNKNASDISKMGNKLQGGF